MTQYSWTATSTDGSTQAQGDAFADSVEQAEGQIHDVLTARGGSWSVFVAGTAFSVAPPAPAPAPSPAAPV